MFYYLTGIISETGQNSVVLDVGGIGFLISTSLNTVSALKRGQEAKLYISESIGENNYDLYGFSDLQEKRFFELLIGISGVGPKAAISLLSAMNTDTLMMAVFNEDLKTITSAPGIGKKIAQRIVLELREKLGAEMPNLAASAGEPLPARTGSGADSRAMSDALAALSVLGYSTAEVSPVLRSGDWTGMSSDQIIRAVLKSMV